MTWFGTRFQSWKTPEWPGRLRQSIIGRKPTCQLCGGRLSGALLACFEHSPKGAHRIGIARIAVLDVKTALLQSTSEVKEGSKQEACGILGSFQ